MGWGFGAGAWALTGDPMIGLAGHMLFDKNKRRSNPSTPWSDSARGIGAGFLGSMDEGAGGLSGGGAWQNRGPLLQKAFLQGEMGPEGYLSSGQQSLETAGRVNGLFNQSISAYSQGMNSLGASGLASRYARQIAQQGREQTGYQANEAMMAGMGESNSRRFQAMLGYVNSASESAWTSKQGAKQYKLALKGLQVQKEAAIYSAVGSVAGAAGGAVAASDRRVKKNVEYVGTELGRKTYDFEYAGKFGKQMPGLFRGVMADEVELDRPDAVSVNRNGVKMVDYQKLGMSMFKVA